MEVGQTFNLNGTDYKILSIHEGSNLVACEDYNKNQITYLRLPQVKKILGEDWVADYTTIQVSVEVKTKLDAMKVHPRQSYNEVIEALIDRNSTEVKEE